MSNMVWALASLHYTPDQMWIARLDRESEHQMTRYAPQNLSNTAWAFATFRCAAARVLPGVCVSHPTAAPFIRSLP
eukprot:350348-Chlamydomonas_euryale.AAC.2